MTSAHAVPRWDDIVWHWCWALTSQSELGSAASFSVPERTCMTAVIFFLKYQVELISETIRTWDLCKKFKLVVVFVCFLFLFESVLVIHVN